MKPDRVPRHSVLLIEESGDVADPPRYHPSRTCIRLRMTRSLRLVRGCRGGLVSRAVDSHTRRLRATLGPHAGALRTVRGEGYRFRSGEGAP